MSENLITYPYEGETHTTSGITFTDNGDGTITIDGSCVEGEPPSFWLNSSIPVSNDKNYLVTAEIIGGKILSGDIKLTVWEAAYSIFERNAVDKYTKCDTVSTYIDIYDSDTVCENLTIRPIFQEITTADRFTTIAENVPKVYHSGQLSVLQDSEVLHGKESGTAIAVNDVSPVEHGLGVKLRSKNLIPYPYQTTTEAINGVTFTDNSDGTITVNGTATGNCYFWFHHRGLLHLKSGKYILSGCPQGGSLTTYSIVCANSDKNYAVDCGQTNCFTELSDIYCGFCIVIMKDTTANNLIFKPQLELGSTATPYTPYVSDLTGIEVSKYGRNLFNPTLIRQTGAKGITIAREEDGLRLSGTATADSYIGVCATPDVKIPIPEAWQNKKITIFAFGNHLSLEVGFYNDDGSVYFGNTIYSWPNAMIEVDTGGRTTFWFRFRFTKDQTYNDFIRLMVCAGDESKPLPYEPYISPQTATSTADGTVTGLTSLSPNMTLLTDNDGVIIDLEYYKDVDLAFENLTSEIALSGGE